MKFVLSIIGVLVVFIALIVALKWACDAADASAYRKWASTANGVVVEKYYRQPSYRKSGGFCVVVASPDGTVVWDLFYGTNYAAYSSWNIGDTYPSKKVEQ